MNERTRRRIPLWPAAASVAGTVFAVGTALGSYAGAAGPMGKAPQSEAATISPLVSTDWVAEHLDDPDVLIVAVAMGHDGSLDRFVPGSVFLDYHAIETSEDLPVELPPVETLVETLRAIGVSNDSHVVLYGPAPAHIAARGFVTLEYLGHDRVSVMNGGIEAWRAEGRPTVATPAAPQPGGFQAHVNRDMLVDAAWIAERLGDSGVALIDARPREQFEGPSNRGLRPGHIPGARNLYFVELLESEAVHRLKPLDQARALFEAAGAADDKVLVSYCQIGMRASYNYLIARHLGYDVKFYDQSWVDWGRRTELPAEIGPARR